MKTLIVQGLNESNIKPISLKQFWYPCMVTVKRWAKRNGFDYKYFNNRRNDDFDISSWDVTYGSPAVVQVTINQYHKLQWMDGWADYDYVFWLDSDCYIYGNPLPFRLDKNPPPALYFLNNELVLGRFHRPNMSVWGGNQEFVQDAIDWARYQFEHPDEQHELVQTLRCLNRYPAEIHIDNYGGGLRQNISIHNFTEEIFMIGYTQSRLEKTVYLHPEGKGFSSLGSAAQSWTPDSIIHFGGNAKLTDLTRFRAYMAYMAYLGQKAPMQENYGKDPTYQELMEGVINEGR